MSNGTSLPLSTGEGAPSRIEGMGKISSWILGKAQGFSQNPYYKCKKRLLDKIFTEIIKTKMELVLRIYKEYVLNGEFP
ncbi:hypothetical protein MC28_E067 (plasmid) [Bacillus thuringiensis MC28]|nr:hypothetical protein MC28_E067 [Bacillus thuringiensis MC28]